MKTIILIAAMLAGGSAFADLNCSDATGNYRINETRYEGGPAPMKGHVMSDEKIYINGQLAGENIELYQLPPKTSLVTASDDESTLKILNQENQGGAQLKEYVVKTTITQKAPTPTAPQLKPVSVFMVCSDLMHFYP